MRHEIERAIETFSPKHANTIKAEVAKLPKQGDIAAVAATVRSALEASNAYAADFPNPFGSPEHGGNAAAWAGGWEGDDHKETTALPSDLGSMTKKQIDEWAAAHGITLDRRRAKPDMIEELRLSLEANRDPIEEDAARAPTGEPGGNALPQ